MHKHKTKHEKRMFLHNSYGVITAQKSHLESEHSWGHFSVTSLRLTCRREISNGVRADRFVRTLQVAIDGLVVSALAIGPKVRGFKLGRGR
jgi:hypothetical protein